jgi:1-acyl-sn-glycerol-3-phosphate acyltransferase
MGSLLANTTRRLITISAVYAGLVLFTTLLPILLPIGALVDAARWVNARTPAMALRMGAFAWYYLLGEAWAILALAIVGLLPRHRVIDWNYRAQQVWLDWNFDVLRMSFGLTFIDEGTSAIPPGPILLLSRHASMIDTMLPGRYVVKPHRIKLRYVLKKELLIDPALDIGGNRLPNYFIDRRGSAQAEMAALRELATGLAADEGVLIYPEGTRYSEEKRVRYSRHWVDQGGPIGEIVAGFRRVLPPKPGGTLALLDASVADVVVLAHRGLEGFARVKDMWSGGLVGTTVELRFWRVPRSAIPNDDKSRLRWLFDLWADVDAWVTGSEAANR